MVKRFRGIFYFRQYKINLDKHKHTGYSTGFDCRLQFSLTDGNVGKNVIISGANLNSSVHVDNKVKDILGLHYNGRDSFLLVDATKIY